MPIVKATRQDWIEAGLEAYGEGGRPALVVERLAARLGTAKAGFYWHFADRDTFVGAMIDHWEAETTSRLVVDAPFERFARAVFASRRYVDVEWQLRRAADDDTDVAGLLARIDGERLAHIAGLLRAEGVPDADGLAVLLYDQFLGWAGRHRRPSEAELETQVTRALSLVERWGR
jgi:AcrR family transcriptional regulator